MIRRLFIIIPLVILIALTNHTLSMGSKKIIKVIVTATHMAGDEKSKVFRLWGNVRIEQSGMVVAADEATYNGENKTFELIGNVSFSKPGALITGEKITIYQEKQFGTWEGNVKLVQQKISNDNSQKNINDFLKDAPLVLTCKKLEFHWGKVIKAVARGQVIAEQKDKKLTSDSATYIENPQKLILEGNVTLGSQKGSSVSCKKLILNIKKEEVEIQEGTFEIKLPFSKK